MSTTNYPTARAVITDVVRVGTSAVGNPTYRLDTEDGRSYRTSTNTGWAYEATNPEWRDTPVVLVLTRAGRVRWVEHDTAAAVAHCRVPTSLVVRARGGRLTLVSRCACGAEVTGRDEQELAAGHAEHERAARAVA